MSKFRSLRAAAGRLPRKAGARLAALAVVVFSVTTPVMAQAVQKRVALVIGNADYASLPKLVNPHNDMREVAATLRAAQFEVFQGRNLSRIEFEEVLKSFLRAVENADVSLVYYSGHGIQIGGRNYLVPVDAKLSTPYDVEIESVNVDNIYGYLRENSRMQLIFLDACRDNPFRADQYWVADKLERAGKAGGLAAPASFAAPARQGFGMGSLFAFSTEPDKVAYDGAGELSYYTQAFVKRALSPNLELRQMLTQVRRDVIASTGGKQVPWENSSLVDDFFMMKLPSGPMSTPIHRVTLAQGSTGGLALPAPQSPSGSPLTITFDRVPERGRLMLGEQTLPPGRALQVADLAHLRYDTSGVPQGHVELVTYTVSDKWKQSVQGAIAIAVSEALVRSAATSKGTRVPRPAEPAPPRVAEAPKAAEPVVAEPKPAEPKPAAPKTGEAHAYVARLAKAALSAQIGIGRAPLGLAVPLGVERPDSLSLTFTEVPASGALYVGAKRIETGTVVALSDVPMLAFEPKIGTQGEVLPVRFTLDTGDRRSNGTLSLKPTLNPCDAEAAEPFDLQGVAPGRLPNEINPPTALAACTAALERYPAIARFQYQLGRSHIAARNIGAGWSSFEKAAAMDHVRALYALGHLTRQGVGRPSSLEGAAEFFRRGADRGDPYGLYDYGKALYYGRGVARDTATGLRLMLRAADMGHTYAMNELGYIFLEGVATSQDTERGLRFYQSGVARKDIYSFNNVGLAHLAGKGVNRDAKAAFGYFSKAADGGHPYAATNLARLYRDGVGTPASLAKAVSWFERGAERGDYWGALERAQLALNGAGSLRNGIDAAYYLALAAAINRPGVGDAENRARRQLAALSDADKTRAEQRLMQQIGTEAGSVQASAGDDRLIALARKAWERRNPRLDLF